MVQFIKNCNRIMNFWVFILAKLTSFDLTIFLWKKLQNRKNCVLTKNTFCSIFPVLINLQKCTIPHFKGNFIIKDLFLYHGWVLVVSGAARDENVSLLTFGTPSIMVYDWNHNGFFEIIKILGRIIPFWMCIWAELSIFCKNIDPWFSLLRIWPSAELMLPSPT